MALPFAGAFGHSKIWVVSVTGGPVCLGRSRLIVRSGQEGMLPHIEFGGNRTKEGSRTRSTRRNRSTTQKGVTHLKFDCLRRVARRDTVNHEDKAQGSAGAA